MLLSVLAVTALLHFQLQTLGMPDLTRKQAAEHAELRRTAVPSPVSPEPSPPVPPPIATLMSSALEVAIESSPPPSPPPLPPPSPPRRSSESLQFEEGEAIGPPSPASLCVLMPVRSTSLVRALRSVRSWGRPHAEPCGPVDGVAVADLAFFHSQSFEHASEDMRFARELFAALRVPAPGAAGEARWSPTACVGAVRFLAARIPVATDVYTIYPSHNFTGPNTHFLRAFDRLQGLERAGVARYTHFQLLESDSYPVRSGWLAALAALAPRGKAWVRGSLSRCIRPNEQAHVNGNAMYALSPGFVNTLRSEMLKRLDSWAFDVRLGYWLEPLALTPTLTPSLTLTLALALALALALVLALAPTRTLPLTQVLLGYWLFRSHPRRIASSGHVLSISTFQVSYPHPDPNPDPNPTLTPTPTSVPTFQRNRSCCEFVQSLVSAPKASRATQPQLYLLHMGNLGKLPDSSVPPSMRALALALQDQFVPRSQQPYATEASNPRRADPRQVCYSRA